MAGYPQIVRIMSQHEELAILRKFNDLSLQNLLFLQAELMHLQEKHDGVSAKNALLSSNPFKSRDWWSLTQVDEDGKSEQWDMFLEIRAKLENYQDRLCKHIRIANGPRPDPYNLQFFQDWIEGPDLGNFPLRGPDRHAWGKDYEVDLIALQRCEAWDPFSVWLIRSVIPRFHRLIGYRIKKSLHTDGPEPSPITEYSDSRLLSIVSVISTVLACLVPVSAIVVLYVVSSMRARIGILVLFTASFALCLSLVTQARKVEIFTATSAFAAVIVVFLSGNTGKIG